MEELLGFLQDEGYSPKEIRELVGPYVAEAEEGLSEVSDDPGGRGQALKDVLTLARDARTPPGPQEAVPSGALHVPADQSVKAIRVDTEESYREFRQSGEGGAGQEPLDMPGSSENITDALSHFSQEEVLGNVMDFGPASHGALFEGAHGGLSPNQDCLLCGRKSPCEPLCASCRAHHVELFQRGYASQVLGSLQKQSAYAGYEFERGYASQVIGKGRHHVGFEGRGPASHLTEDAYLSATVGDGFFRRTQDTAEYGYDGLSALIGDVSALAVPSTVFAEETPLSFHRPDQQAHTSAWKQGGQLYSSIRVTGFDGRSRVLTATTPYAKEVGIVVGYAESARIAPTHTVAILDPLARQLGSSRLFPRLAAAAPAVLRVAREHAAPHITAVMGR